MRSSLLLILFPIALLLHSARAQTSEDPKSFLHKLDTLPISLKEQIDEFGKDEVPTWAYHSLDYGAGGLDAVLFLWADTGQRWPAQLAWWKSKSRHTRMLCVTLYYLEFTDRDRPQVPNFAADAGRFDPEEENERIEEFKFVAANLKAIKEKLGPSLTLIKSRTK